MKRVFSALAGAAISVVSSILVQYALLDILFETWAQWYYGVLFILTAIFVHLGGNEVMARRCTQVFVGAFVTAGILSFGLAFTIDKGVVMRVVAFSILGITLNLSLLISSLIVAAVFSWVCCHVGSHLRRTKDTRAAAWRLFWLCTICLLEGAFFGGVIAVLETQDRPHIFHMPHADAGMVIPATLIFGAFAGWMLQDNGLLQVDEDADDGLELITNPVDELTRACAVMSHDLCGADSEVAPLIAPSDEEAEDLNQPCDFVRPEE